MNEFEELATEKSKEKHKREKKLKKEKKTKREREEDDGADGERRRADVALSHVDVRRRVEADADERPTRAVSLAGYFLGKHEVSWGQYMEFCYATERAIPRREIQEHPGRFAATDDHPVFHVSWEDAQAYCAWAGLRLPTEA